MKGEWYLPIRLVPDNGKLLRIYLVGLHLGCAAVFYGVLPTWAFAIFGIGLVVLLTHHLQGIVSCRQVNSLSIQPRHRVILTDHHHSSESARLLRYRLVAGFAFVRVVRSGRVISMCCRRDDQGSAQWHRLVLMQRYDQFSGDGGNQGV